MMALRDRFFGGWDWDPLRELDRMHRHVHRVLATGWPSRLLTPFPAVNVWTGEERSVVTAELPGVNTEDLHVSVERDVLTVTGSREREPLGEGEVSRRHERGHGSFTRTVKLPYSVDTAGVEATYKKGVLRIVLPRSERSKPKRIEVTG